jgi:hypothetical protein
MTGQYSSQPRLARWAEAIGPLTRWQNAFYRRLLAKRLLWSGLDAASLEAHMRHEGVAQLYVRNLTGNFEEMIKARKDHRTPVYLDDPRQKDT